MERDDSPAPARWFWESSCTRAEYPEEITLVANLDQLRAELAAEYARAEGVRSRPTLARW